MTNQPFDDYYEALQISPNADGETIARVFRHLAKRYHPDNPETGDVEKFDRLSKAHRILSDPEKRAGYDARHQTFWNERWQVAKEKAQHYWMEEGLTGYYYEYAQKNKLKGDLKEYFIQDYILWIHFESQGMQKLSREVRTIFWRYIPFPQTIKDNLKNRGYYYAELYKKAINDMVAERETMYHVCQVCGYIAEDDAPDRCPVCVR